MYSNNDYMRQCSTSKSCYQLNSLAHRIFITIEKQTSLLSDRSLWVPMEIFHEAKPHQFKPISFYHFFRLLLSDIPRNGSVTTYTICFDEAWHTYLPILPSFVDRCTL